MANKSTLSCSVVPAPTSVNVASNPDSPIRPIGADVAVMCTVILSSAVDVPVTVNTIFTGPGVFEIKKTTTENNSTYVSTAMITSFGRNNSGIYSCMATVSSNSPFLYNSTLLSRNTSLTVGKNLLHECQFVAIS